MVLGILLVFSIALAPQQDSPLDSLQKELALARHDTIRLKILNQLAEEAGDYALLKKYSEEMETVADRNLSSKNTLDKNKFLSYKATALNNLAFIKENDGEVEKAIALYEQSILIFDQAHDNTGKANALNNLGFVLKFQGQYLKALDLYQQSLLIYEEQNEKTKAATVLNNMGLIFFNLGDMNKALDYYNQSLKIGESMHESKVVGQAYNNISGVYYSQEDYETSLTYLEKTLIIAKELNNDVKIANTLQNMAGINSKLGQYRSAIKNVNQALALNEKRKFKSGIANCFSSIAENMVMLNKTDSAIFFYKRALSIHKEQQNQEGYAFILNKLGEIDLSKNNLQGALPYLEESLSISRQLGYPKNISVVAENLFKTYQSLHKFKEALDMHKLFVQMRDSIANEGNRKLIIKNQFKYEYGKKAAKDSIQNESEKKVLTAQLSQTETQRLALTMAIVFVLTVAGFSFFRYRSNQRIKELKLRNHIASDLHDDVGSAISSIALYAGMARMKNIPEVNDIVTQIENTSRETIDTMGDIIWSIEPLNDDFSNMLKRMKQFGEHLLISAHIQFQFQIDQNIEKLNLNMTQRKNIYLIYKEALNNAAKYSKARKVIVSMTRNADSVTLNVTDDGQGFNLDIQSMGNGLRNMERRAVEIKGALKIITAHNQGTSLSVTVPVS